MRPDPQPREAGPRALLLAAGADALAALDAAPARDLSIRLRAACGKAVPESAVTFPVRRVRPARGLRPFAPRTLAASARSRVAATRASVPGRWLWSIKSDPWLRRRLQDTDVVLSADSATDRVLELVPDLVGGTVVVPSKDVPGLWGALDSLVRALVVLEDQRRERVVGSRIDRRQLDPGVLAELESIVEPAQARLVPPALLPVSRMAHTVRWLGPALGPEHGAHIVANVLGHYPWEDAPGADAAGLTAQWASARIWMAQDESLFPEEDELADAAEAALAGADEALAAGRGDLARGRLVDAMALLFHRERHAETLRSPLVADPAGYLAALYANRTYRELVGGGTRPTLRTRPAADAGPPRVLVLGGAYGNFHRPVVEALSDVATVTLRRPRPLNRFFARKIMDPQVVDALAALRGGGPPASRDEWATASLGEELRQALVPRLRRADVVFADWADRLTIWASHLVPPGCRLVVRIHSLDALHPWFHLVDWSAVDQVIVVSEPLRRLVEQMLQAAGASVPVTVVANLAALHEAGQPKDPGARTTLGMVGWGRRVKDPLWALDLLTRDPEWRLVLIGPDLPGRSASAKAYYDEVHRRLDDPDVRDRVEVVGWTDDVARHLRRVGVILSTSRRESWHLGLVEGAASGAVPVVRDWPIFAPVGGARTLFPEDWVVETLDEAEQRIRAVTADPAVWEEARQRARQEALALFDPSRVARDYRDVILGPSREG